MKHHANAPQFARAVAGLSNQARDAAAAAPNLLADVTRVVKATMHSEADPYLLMGVLLEGIVQTMRTRIPDERRGATELATITLLQQRIAVAAASQPRPTRYGQA